MIELTEGEIARFWSRVDRGGPDECWDWQGKPNRDGYGQFTITRLDYRTTLGSHRVAFALTNGGIPDDLKVHHRCPERNPLCCNPAHLSPLKQGDHVMEPGHIAAVQAEKTHCAKGHPFTPENTYIWKGWRYCRTCNRESKRKN